MQMIIGDANGKIGKEEIYTTEKEKKEGEEEQDLHLKEERN